MARKSRKPERQVELTVSKRRTAIYTRLSREDVKKKGDSLVNQRHIIEQHLMTFPELGTPSYFEDNGYSGKDSNRPQLQEMLAQVEAGEIECIIVKDASRLGRNSIETTYYIETLFPKHDVRFISVTDGFDSAINVDGADYTMIFLKNMLNEAYSIDLSKKIKASKRQMMKEGGFIGRKAPFGYQKSKDDVHKLEIDPITSPIVKLMFEQVLVCNSRKQLLEYFRRNNYVTPLQAYHQAKGTVSDKQYNWRETTITRILKNKVYIGHMVQGKSQNRNRVSVKVEPEKYYVVKNTHEPIISEEVFNKVQKRLENWTNSYLDSLDEVTENKSKNMYRGKLYCGVCGKALYRETSRNTKLAYFRYSCKSNKIIAKGFCQKINTKSIKESDVSNVVASVLELQSEILLGKRLSVLKKESEVTKKQDKIQKELEELDQNVLSSQFFLKGLYENYIAGILTITEYKDMKLSYEEKIQESKTNFLVLSEEKYLLDNELSLLGTMSQELSASNLEVTQELLDKFIDKIFVFDDKKIEIRFSFNFPKIDEVMGNE